MQAGTTKKGPLGIALVLALLVAFSAAPASAAEHPFLADLSKDGFHNPCGVATDSAGNLYVAAYGDETIFVFDPAGNPITEFSPSANAEVPCGIAVDSNGNVYATGWQSDVVKYAPSSFPPSSATTYSPDTTVNGTGTLVPSANAATSVAVDPSTDNVYVAEGDHISSYEPDGTLISATIGLGVVPGAAYYGVDVYGATGEVYVTDAANDRAYILNPAGTAVRVTIDGSDSPAGAFTAMEYPYLAVDQANGNVFVADIAGHGVVDEFDADGHFVSEISHSFEEAEPSDVAVDRSGGPNDGNVYVTSGPFFAGSTGDVFAFGPLTSGPEPPVVTIDQPSASEFSATITGTIDTKGAETAWQVETTTDPSCAGGFTSEPVQTIAAGESAPVAVQWELSNLQPNQRYCARIAAANGGGAATSATVVFTTSTASPRVETVGSPYRSATGARLDARVNALGTATTYHFEYGTDSGYGNRIPLSGELSAGAKVGSVLVTARIEGLEPGTTYHYRVVATSAGGTEVGDDMTLTTRASDAPLGHGPFPGPPGSDRAWEHVNLQDTGGNAVQGATAIADDGERTVYNVAGGTPVSDTGTLSNQLFAERGPSGWQTRQIYPRRSEAPGNFWLPVAGRSDLSQLIGFNFDSTAGAGSYWRLSPDTPPAKLYATDQFDYFAVSDDASRVIAELAGTQDPAHPVTGKANLYDVSSGSPELVSLLPDGTVPACGVDAGPLHDIFNLPVNFPPRSVHWISADGSLAFFPSQGHDCDTPPQLYVRDIDAGLTKRVSPPPVSGAACGAAFIRSTVDAAFFWTAARLASADSAPPATCDSNGDVYRYDLATGGLSCVTCAASTSDADVVLSSRGAFRQIGVAADGSRVYFNSPHALVAGEGPGIYRVDVGSGDLEYVGPGGPVGDSARVGEAMTADGSVIVFTSADIGLNALTASDNGGMDQYYRYDDRDGSLVCVSCPVDGSAPAGPVVAEATLGVGGRDQAGPNLTPLTADGDFAFATPTPLAPADRNTAGGGSSPASGTDLYEWRDGLTLLVTDGATVWPGAALPEVSGFTPSGRDLFFTAAAQLTPDAPDANQRLYDARIGGGFELPQGAPTCAPGECQGGSTSAPVRPAPGTATFVGPGNASPQPGKRRCARHARRARRLAALAERLRRSAAHSDGPRAERLRAKGRRMARAAKRRAAAAARCRAQRRAAKRGATS